jgi:NADH:ubiquinone oxidoreductase subunit F (NADH-binding)/(2Fe-2S) ferredoxin/ferredoxin
MGSAISFDDVRKSADSEWAEFIRAGRRRVLVGAATCGRAAGALEVLAAFREEVGRQAELEDVVPAEVGCLGLCYAEVLVEITGADGRRVLYSGVEPGTVPELVESHLVKGEPVVEHALALMDGPEIEGVPRFENLAVTKDQVRVVLRNSGVIDPSRIEHYIGRGGYSGLVRALSMGPDKVIDEVTASGLRGRGGAGFPTGRKWSFARNAPGDEKYVICNADEGDPGAFMDRAVLESDPHAVLEGLMTAGYAVGAGTGYVYVRAEYPLAIERLETAIAQARGAGLLGKDVLGSGFSFDVEIRKGAGAFVCGEETALMASIEGRRGMPRARPPFPATSGLHAKPTNINNVETLAAVSAIMDKGAEWYSQFGTEKSRGTKTFALAGKIERTGLIEVPLGVPLRTVIFDIGGGIPDGKKLKAVQTGGPSGGCIPAEQLDLPVDFEHLAEAGSIMGSGGMIVMDEDSCMVDVAKYFVAFTEDESCGKCVPCRMGTQHLVRILTDISEGRGGGEMIEQLKLISDTMEKGSLCALGRTAPNPVLSTLRYFPEEYEAHVTEKRCPALACKALVIYGVDEGKCTGCGACRKACPVGAVSGKKKKPHAIDAAACIGCDACRQACRFDAVTVQ